MPRAWASRPGFYSVSATSIEGAQVGRQGKTLTFFAMNTHIVPFRHAYDMLQEIRHRLSKSRCGEIHLTRTCEHGSYYVAFANREAADQFERLYRQATGTVPRRSIKRQREVRGFALDLAVVAMMLENHREFSRRMSARWN